MIEFIYETDFRISNKNKYTDWLQKLIVSEVRVPGNLCFVLSTDDKVLEINERYLNHSDYTDIITFDYCQGKELHGDIFISMERIKENAEKYNVEMEEELRRVMAHGLLHLIGYSDKSKEEKEEMRRKEDEKLKMFHVER